MKIVFLSNFFNHHQAALSDALWEKTCGEYLFVETSPMPQERRALGYPTRSKVYVLPLVGNETRILREIREADAVIAGSAPEWLVRQRIKTGKLLFRYSERPLRNGTEPLKVIPRWFRWHWRNPVGKPIYLLCASAFASGDYAKFGLFRNHAFCWGYFPERKQYHEGTLLSSKDPAQILWCGRLLSLKHPEEALQAAHILKQEGYAFQLTFIGIGEMESQLRQMVRDFCMEDCVQFLGARPPEEVRNAMEKAGIYLFTSDRQEGWGAVLNEAMNSGCAVVASHAIGAVPFLVKPEENALVYRAGDTAMLCQKIRYLLEHPQEQKRLGAEAYRTIRDIWNGETAAERLITLIQRLPAGEKAPQLFEDGPCSRAVIVTEDWFA